MGQNKELEATEERKRKAKQLELQRKESARTGRGNVPRTPVYPSYTPPARSNVPDPTTSYEAEKNKSFSKYVQVQPRYYILDMKLTLLDQTHCAQGQGHATWKEVKDY